MENIKEKVYKTGSLIYTKKDLTKLFGWLMAGDFCYMMEGNVDPLVLTFMLKKINASSITITLLLTTIPALLNFILNPIISTYSDRYRSKWGRRKPFLVVATPIIAIMLVLTGYAPQIGKNLHKAFSISETVPVTLVLIAAVTVMYRISSLFVGTTFYYLLNDVVPEEVMGRFTTGFRIFSLLSSSVLGVFGYQYVESHPQYLCLTAAMIYLIGFGIMCLKVDEGTYPPPLDTLNKTNPFKMISVYARECFCNKIYIYYFLAYAFFTLWGAGNPFTLLMIKESFHVELKNIGLITAGTSILSFLALVPAGFLADKFHPIRVFMISIACLILIYPALIFWAFWQRSGNMVPLVISMKFVEVIFAGVAGTVLFPLGMRVVPRLQYGQFSSAAAMLSSILLIIFSIIPGIALDYLKNVYHGDSFYLRYAIIWGPAMYMICLVFMFLTYKKWKQLGGDKSYVPPTAICNSEVAAETP